MAPENEPTPITARQTGGGPAWYVHVRYTPAGDLADLNLATDATAPAAEPLLGRTRLGTLVVGPFPDRGTAAVELGDMARQAGQLDGAQ